MTKQRIAFFTQGCRLNQSETAVIEYGFRSEEYDIVDYRDAADVVVVNTCTVTENGDADTRRLVNRLVRINPCSKIALVGCQAQILKEKLLKLPNVSWVVGNDQKMNIRSIIASGDDLEGQVIAPKMARESFEMALPGVDRLHTRANIKIQDGCDFYCSFCVIPFARGPARSRDFENILWEARQLVDAGHREIVLTGINLGTYAFEDKTFFDVILALEDIEGLDRIRISSIEPTTIDRRVILHMAKSTKLCRHLHIPLQSGDDSVLKAMARKYSIAEFMDFISFVSDTVDNVCIGTDVIVGFPGESDDQFMRTQQLLKDSPIDYFHVFSYSERKFARSKRLGNTVAPEVIKQRSLALRELSTRCRLGFYSEQLGSVVDVLFEQEKEGYWVGLTDHYVKVRVSSKVDLANRICLVRLDEVDRVFGAVMGVLHADIS